MLDPDGVPVKRNFVHVTDLVEAMLMALDHPKARQGTFPTSAWMSRWTIGRWQTI